MSSGGRIVLKLRAESEQEIRYDAELESEREPAKSQATIRIEDGLVSFAAWEPKDPPAWLVDSARAILRAEWRSKSWPRRITRWRAAK